MQPQFDPLAAAPGIVARNRRETQRNSRFAINDGAFLGFTRLLWGWEREGRSTDLYRALIACGVTPSKAHDCIERWSSIPRREGLSKIQSTAIHLAAYIPHVYRRRWGEELHRVIDYAILGVDT